MIRDCQGIVSKLEELMAQRLKLHSDRKAHKEWLRMAAEVEQKMQSKQETKA